MDIIKIITRRHLNFNLLLILIKEWSNAFSSRFTTSWFKEKYFKFYHTILCCYLYINFARRLLIRSLVSILHNLFSISRQHISFLARFQTGKKNGFLKKKFWYLRRLSLFTCGLGFISCPTIRSIFLFLLSWWTKTLNTCSLQSRSVKGWCRTPDLWQLYTYSEFNASNFLPIK